MRNLLSLACIPVLLSIARGVPADDDNGLDYVSDAELKTEIAERQADIERTRARLAELSAQEQTASVELDHARLRLSEIEAQTLRRVRVYYYMSRNAGSLRFLLDAASPTEAVRRVTLLRRLLVDALEDRRAAGLRLVEAERRLTRLTEDEQAARQMLDMLGDALKSRIDEAAGRGMSVPRIRPNR